MFCFAFPFPIGLAFLNAGLREGVVWGTGQGWAWEFNLGLFMIALPLLPPLVHLVRYLKGWKYPKHRTKAYAAEFWSFYAQKISTEEFCTTIENPDPSSIEFACTYNDLMSDILADPRNTIVIVMDNLDRVASEEQAKSIWSTMQIFFQSQECTGRDWYDRLWVLVPYDRTGIERLWRDAAQSFIDKTFQVRFEVPPPALSDWRQFFVDKLAEAMPQHTREEFLSGHAALQ